MSDLKPCPFCGLQPSRTATVRRDGTEFNIHYWCNHQDRSGMQTIETGHFGKEQYAVDCWNARPVAEVPSVEELMAAMDDAEPVEGVPQRYTEILAIHALLIQRQGGRLSSEQVADKIVTDWLAEVGKDEHGIDWDDLADLKNRIAKALTKA